MTNTLPRLLFLAAATVLFDSLEIEAFLSTPHAALQQARQPAMATTSDGRGKHHPVVTPSSSSSSSSLLWAVDFKQHPGESDIDFIKRITSSTNAMFQESNNKMNNKKKNSSSILSSSASSNNNSTDPSTTTSKPRGTYQRIEEWDEERTAKGELTWEEKVQFEGQRFGNRVKQDDILRHHIGTFF